MPVLDQTTSNSYTGNGVTTVFAYTFKLLDEADVLVEVDGVAKTLTTHYTVSGVGNSGGGNITFLSAPANATEVVIQRDMAYLRETDYQDNGDLLAATLDEDIDRVVMQGQQTRDGVARAAKLPVTVTGVDPTLPVPVANRGLKWNAAADGFENGDSDLDAIEAAVAASAAAAASSESAASASAVTAAAEADEATNQAASAAASALSAASVVSQDLSAIDRTVFSATIVDTFLYDTSKDSDGGAWRKRCAHTSWENETLSGNWLGSAANETAARLIAGATTGSYYYDTTALGFYTLNAGSGKTATYRGNVRQFPAQVLITVEAARVVLWDLTQAGAPMWMSLQGTIALALFYANSGMSSAHMLNGHLVIGQALAYVAANFISDTMENRLSSAGYRSARTIGNRSLAWSSAGSTTAIVNDAVNDVAMTVLPNAPVDVATGLPIPVIDVFTDAGTSRINSDGTVADLVDTAGDDHKAGCILASGDSVALNSTNGNVDIYKLSNTLADTLTPDRTYDQTTVPALLEAVDAGDKIVAMKHRFAVGQDNGVNVLIENPASVAAGMIAYMTKDVPPMWQVGAVKGAWLADTVAETITGTELVTNGTFTTDLSGWTLSASTPPTWNASGAIQFNSDGVTFSTAEQALTTITGKTYTLSLSMSSGSHIYVYVGSTSGATDMVNASVSVDGTHSFTFTASGTTSYLKLIDGAAASAQLVDNVSCRLADVDRSVKAKGLQVFGSLTKAAVASGAQLMGYSGFSAANYFEQPYNSDLDFGTGDFCIMGWLTEAPNSAIEYLFNRDSATPGKAIRLWVSVAGYLVFELYDGTTTRTATGTVAVDTSTRLFWLVTYSAGTLTIYVNGVSYATATGAALLTLTNASAVTRIGLDVAGSYPATNANLALVRAGATVPSAEQIKRIYETENAMFAASANCCLAGSSNSVTALAYDEETDLLHVGTSYGRSAFKGLVRVSSEATPVGAITALAAGAGVIVQGGATAVDVYVPAYTLREELLRDAEQMARFGQNLIAHDFTATASQTTFTLPVGWGIVAVYQQGAIKRETTSWTRSFDGFKWSAVLGTGATVSDWISILAKRV